MKNHFFKAPFIILITSLLFALALIHQKNKKSPKPIANPTPVISTLSNSHSKPSNCETQLFTRTLLPNRLSQFIKLLNQKGAHLRDLNDFTIKTKDWTVRKQLALQTGINYSWIQIHSELAELLQCGLHQIDAQMLHFSQWNHRDPFTSEIMNQKILSTSDSENLLINIQGWQAGNYDPIVERYNIDLASIDAWIKSAKLNPAPTLSYHID